MRRYMLPLIATFLLNAGTTLVGVSRAEAALIDLGSTVYDDGLGVAWLKDANLAAVETFGVSGIDASGGMNWFTAQNWITAMNAANYLGHHDWRLPTITDTGDPGCDYSYGGTDCGYNVDPTTSEMAHLYYDELHNISAYDALGVLNPAWVIGTMNTGPFVNIVQITNGYWSSTESATDSDRAWRNSFGDGYQTAFLKTSSDLHVIPLRDVTAVPEPASLLLLGVGLSALGVKARGRLRRRPS